MAWLAQRLQVGLIEEENLIALVRYDMVTDQFRCVAFDLAAACHLARKEITLECSHAQPLPPNQLIPLAPRLCSLTVLVAILLITGRWPKPWRQATDAWLQCRKSAHTHKAKRRPTGRLSFRHHIAVALALNRCLASGDCQGWVQALEQKPAKNWIDHGRICTHTFSSMTRGMLKTVGFPKIMIVTTASPPFASANASTETSKPTNGPLVIRTLSPFFNAFAPRL